jgi:hypothetical protein
MAVLSPTQSSSIRSAGLPAWLCCTHALLPCRSDIGPRSGQGTTDGRQRDSRNRRKQALTPSPQATVDILRYPPKVTSQSRTRAEITQSNSCGCVATPLEFPNARPDMQRVTDSFTRTAQKHGTHSGRHAGAAAESGAAAPGRTRPPQPTNWSRRGAPTAPARRCATTRPRSCNAVVHGCSSLVRKSHMPGCSCLCVADAGKRHDFGTLSQTRCLKTLASPGYARASQRLS